MSPTTIDALRSAVEQAATSLAPEGREGPRSRPTLERPKRAEFGDFSTNAAMLLAPVVQAAPRDVAARLADALAERLGSGLERTEVAGPGFLNLFLSDAWYTAVLRDLLAAGDAWGSGTAVAERIDVEFVSANPTGPVHIGHARNAAYGDALCRILAFHGHEVTREYYVNDAGSQVAKFGESIRARARGEEVAEDGYVGDYVRELAEALDGAAEQDAAELGRRGVEAMVERIGASLERFRVGFDRWFFESALHEGSPSEVDQAFAELERQGRLYQHEGALWVRTSDLGDDKDRVVRRSTGEFTYYASDIAYHWDKLERGFDRLFDVLGADHHGYVGRMKAAVAAVGGDPARLELLIMRFVNLVRAGQRVSMSKRAGEFVTLDDLMDEIGVDAARWFLLNRSHDTTIDLDLDLAVEENAQNPVYYVQYAHARIASLLRKAGDEVPAEVPEVPLGPAERALVQRLVAFPQEVADASDKRAPHRMATYALELSREFTAFYEAHPVLKEDVPADVRASRLALAAVTQRTIARTLGLLGVTAPDQM